MDEHPERAWKYSKLDILLNFAADIIAGEAAERVDAGLSAETRVKHADRTAAAVQERLCAILQDVANKDKREDIKPKPKRNKEMHNDHILFAQTTHTVIQAEGQLRCSTCGTVAGRTMRVKKRWLKAECNKLHHLSMATARAAVDPVIINLQIHPSHRCLYMTDSSTWVCTTCGMIGREVLEGLSRPCIGVMKSRGSDNWSRIQKGLAPGESRWAKAFNEGRVVRRAKLEGQKRSKEGIPRS